MPVIMPKIRSMGAVGVNVHYGAEAPADTTKLWVKTDTTPTSLAASPKSLETVESERMTCGAKQATKGRYGMAAATVGTKVYLFGGRQDSGQDSTNLTTDIYRYDAEADELVTMGAKLPQKLTMIGAGAVGTKVYLFGGDYYNDSGVDTIQVYDTETDALTTLDTKLTEKACRIAVVEYGTKLYLVSGRSSSFLSTIRVYDTETDTLTTMGARIPVSACMRSAARVGTKIYILGGRWSNGAYRDVYVYDIEADTITTLDLEPPCDLHGAENATEAVGTKIYLFPAEYSAQNRVIFDTETYEFTNQATYYPRSWISSAAAVVAMDGVQRIYMFPGGYTYGAAYRSDAIYMSEFKTKLEAGAAYLKTAADKNLFPFIVGDTSLTVGADSMFIGDASEKAVPLEAYLYNETTSAWELI